MKTVIVVICMAGLLPLAFAGDTTLPRVAPADTRNHDGETAIVCGKVVGADVRKNAIGGYGFPVSFDLDQPEPNPVFYFIAFGAQPARPQEDAEKLLKLAEAAVAAYMGKTLCVTGKITTAPSGGPPFILAAHRSQIKVQPEQK